MAFVIADRVRESSVSTGTGNFTLAGAVTGYQTFASVMATSDTTYYTIADQGGSNWEVGIGTFTSPSTLARTTILSSSNGGSVVTFGAGTKDVFISLPASKTVQSFSAGSTGLTPSTASFGAVSLAGTLVAGNGGTGQSSYAVGDLLYASTTTALSKLADVATGNALISGGVGVAPSYGKIGLTTHISGTLGVGNGGTGTATTFTTGSVVFAGASGVYSQNNSQLFWDNTNNYLGLGTATPSAKLDIAAGNLAFSGTGQRITGDMSNATIANRLMLQTTTTNGATTVSAIPNGTSQVGSFVAFNNSDPTNASTIQMVVTSSESRFTAGSSGTGTYLPMTFYSNNTERMRLDTSGNVGIGTTTIGSKLTVNGDVAGTFFVNPTTVSANYTIPTNYNAMTAGPITVASGATVTVGSGSTWVIV